MDQMNWFLLNVSYANYSITRNSAGKKKDFTSASFNSMQWLWTTMDEI